MTFCFYCWGNFTRNDNRLAGWNTLISFTNPAQTFRTFAHYFAWP